MLAWLELPRVREVQVVSHEEAALGLSRGSNVLVASTAEPLVEYGVDVVADGRQSRRRGLRDVLVELEFHAT